jgi:hypothetical protein
MIMNNYVDQLMQSGCVQDALCFLAAAALVAWTAASLAGAHDSAAMSAIGSAPGVSAILVIVLYVLGRTGFRKVSYDSSIGGYSGTRLFYGSGSAGQPG